MRDLVIATGLLAGLFAAEVGDALPSFMGGDRAREDRASAADACNAAFRRTTYAALAHQTLLLATARTTVSGRGYDMDWTLPRDVDGIGTLAINCYTVGGSVMRLAVGDDEVLAQS